MKTVCSFLAVATILLADVWACQPTEAPKAGARKRRSTDQVTVVLVTNADFDENTNGFAYQKVKQTVTFIRGQPQLDS